MLILMVLVVGSFVYGMVLTGSIIGDRNASGDNDGADCVLVTVLVMVVVVRFSRCCS